MPGPLPTSVEHHRLLGVREGDSKSEAGDDSAVRIGERVLPGGDTSKRRRWTHGRVSWTGWSRILLSHVLTVILTLVIWVLIYDHSSSSSWSGHHSPLCPSVRGWSSPPASYVSANARVRRYDSDTEAAKYGRHADAVQSPVNVSLCDPSYPYPVPSSFSSLYCGPPVPSPPFTRSRRYTRNDVALTLLTVDAYAYDRDEACMQTWLTQERWPTAYFGVSKPRPCELQQPTLLIPHTDDLYLSNLNKTMIGLRELFRLHPNKSWYMQSSDDSYLDIDALLVRLDAFDSEEVWYIGGQRGRQVRCWLTEGTEKGAFMDYFAGGVGFIVSHGLMVRYASEMESWMNEEWLSPRGRTEGSTVFGDVMVGCFMHQHGIQPTHIQGGHTKRPTVGDEGGEDFPSADHRWWGWHYLTPQDMVDAHLFFTLQRIDTLRRYAQWEEMTLHARRAAFESHSRTLRSLAQISAWRENPSLLMWRSHQVQSVDEANPYR